MTFQLTKEQYLEGLVKDLLLYSRGAVSLSISKTSKATGICESDIKKALETGRLRSQGGGGSKGSRGLKHRITCRAIAEFIVLAEERSSLS